MSALLFVYGTLLQGEDNHAALASARRIGAATTEPRYELMDLGPYPALVPDGATAVVGELYEVDEPTLAALDELEGHPDYYRRSAVRLADGRTAVAYLYAARERGMRIAAGDWRRR